MQAWMYKQTVKSSKPGASFSLKLLHIFWNIIFNVRSLANLWKKSKISSSGFRFYKWRQKKKLYRRGVLRKDFLTNNLHARCSISKVPVRNNNVFWFQMWRLEVMICQLSIFGCWHRLLSPQFVVIRTTRLQPE